MAPRQRPDTEPLLLKLLGSATGIAACVAGALYLAGIATLAIRISRAGLAPPDLLPLFSLDDLLRAGLTWISPAVPALAALAAMFLVSLFVERWLDGRAGRFQEQRKLHFDEGHGRIEWEESFQKLRRSTNWEEVGKQVARAIHERGSQDPSSTKDWIVLRVLVMIFQGWTVLILLLLAASLFLLVPLVAIVSLVVLLSTCALIGARPAPAFLAPLFVVVILATLVNAVVNPHPLLKALVITKSVPSKHHGDFIVDTNGNWYLGQRDGRVLTIPERDIVRSHLRSGPRAKSLWGEIKP